MITPDQKRVAHLLDTIRQVAPWVLCEFAVFGAEFESRDLVVGNQTELAEQIDDGDYRLDHKAVGAIWLRCLRMIRAAAIKDKLAGVEVLDKLIARDKAELAEQPDFFWFGEVFGAPTRVKIIYAPIEADNIVATTQYDEGGNDVVYWLKNQLVASISQRDEPGD